MRDRWNCTALSYAVAGGHNAVRDLLVARGATKLEHVAAQVQQTSEVLWFAAAGNIPALQVRAIFIC